MTIRRRLHLFALSPSGACGKGAVLLSFILFSVSASATPFVLSDPRIGASALVPREISVGGSSGGFLLAGLGGNRPESFAVTRNGDAVSSSRFLGLQSANAVAEPLFLAGRWVVPITTDFLAPDRIALAEVATDGTVLGEPRIIPWRGAFAVSLATNGSALLIAATRNLQTGDLMVRTATADLATVGADQLVASAVTAYRIAPQGQGFLVAYRSATGLHAVRLTADGSVAGSPFDLTTAPTKGRIEIATGAGGTMVAWSEGVAPSWSLRAARIDDTSSQNLGEIARFSGDLLPAVLVRVLDDGFLFAWQGVNYIGGNQRGGAIRWGILARDGTWSTAPTDLPGLLGGEVLESAASSGSEAILVWHREFDGVGTVIWGAIVSPSGFQGAKLLALAYAQAKELTMVGSPDGSSWVAWTEMSGTGFTLWIGRWNRDGQRLAMQQVRASPGVIRDNHLANNGVETLLVWQEGSTVAASYVGNDATLLNSEPLIIATGSPRDSIRNPTVASAPGGFVVGWISGSGGDSQLDAAFVAGTPIEPLGAIAVPPARTSYSEFGISSARLAYGGGGGMAAMEVDESFPCFGNPPPPCRSAQYAGVVRFSRADPHPTPVSIVSSSSSAPDVASDGRDFLMVWRGVDGIRARQIASSGVQHDLLLFSRPFASNPVVVWNGTEYVAAWSYQAGQPITGVARLSRSGELLAPPRGIRDAGFPPYLAALPGDALVGWIALIEGAQGVRTAPVAEYASHAELLSLPPAPPTVTLRTSGSMLEVGWSRVVGADSVSVEIVSSTALNRLFLFPMGQGIARIPLLRGDERVRIRALNEGGGSEPLELPIPVARRRATSIGG